MSEPIRTVLWSANSVQSNNTSITLTDSIDNYDEIIYFGSATRTYCPCVMTEYPVISGQLNLGGPFFYGIWETANNFVLCNGTQVFLSGNSGYVAGSYYWGKNNGNTAYVASLETNRASDVRPYMIIGVKYPNNDDRTLLWSSDHSEHLYNTDIQLSETVTHFKEIMVLGSGFENTNVGCRHTTKNVYNAQNKVFGCDTWAYSPWKIAEKHNLVIGQEILISGNSGHIGSGYFMGMGNQTTAWLAGKVTTDEFGFAAPYKIYGLKRKPSYTFTALTSVGGSLSSNIDIGYSGEIATITITPESEVWKMSALNITGAELTGNDFMFNNSNVTAQAEFEHSKDLTLVNGDHGVLSADKMSGFSGDVVTVDATTDEGWYLSGLDITGSVATGTKFMFIGNDVTALGKYTDVGFPVTYLADEHVQCTGDTTIYIPGGTGITLETGYDPYYRISGYEVENGTVENGVLIPTGPCTIRAVATPNYFTATGNFEQGNNVNVTAGNANAKTTDVPAQYALYVGHTGDIPSSWYDVSNRWKPNDASAYSITLNTKMSFSISGSNSIYGGTKGELTAGSLVGSTLLNTAISSRASKGLAYYYYNETFTTTEQNVNYGVSAKLYAIGYYYYHPDVGTMETKFNTQYYASGTTGTWTATGIAP